MKNEKILNFMIAFLLTMIVFNLFLPSTKKTDVVTTSGITLKVLEKDYTVPNIPVLELDNTTANEVSFNTCKDFSIFKDSAKI
jgi:hypothetical protein